MLTSPPSTSKLGKAATIDSDQLQVSILVNNYNYGQFLGECLDSCIVQSYPKLEIIVVDDGSTDDSVNVIRHYASQYPQITPIYKANGGQASAVNTGFAASHGDVIILLDADDYLFPGAIENIVTAWTAARGHSSPGSIVAMLQSRLELVDQGERFIDLYPAPEVSFDQGNVIPLLLQKGRFSTTVTSGLSFSRTTLEQILPIPETDFRLCADGYLVTIAPLTGQVACLERPVGGRRKHLANLWAANEAGVSVEQRRRAIAHDFIRYHHLAEAAIRRGFPALKPANFLGLNDPSHVAERLISLRLEPELHPVTNDRIWLLAHHGFWSTAVCTTLPPRRRFALMLWFLWVAISPRHWAELAIHWRLSSEARPPLIDRLLKALRRLTQ